MFQIRKERNRVMKREARKGVREGKERFPVPYILGRGGVPDLITVMLTRKTPSREAREFLKGQGKENGATAQKTDRPHKRKP